MRFFAVFVCAVLALLAVVQPACADSFVLTDKNDENPVTIPEGNTARTVYVMETKDGVYEPGTSPGSGFTFDTSNGMGSFLTLASAGDFTQGYTQSLAGNELNGYVGTNLYKAWGNALWLSFGDQVVTNGPGADLYITLKTIEGGVAQSTGDVDKSMAVALHIQGAGDGLDGWHLYNPDALPDNYKPAEGAGNPLGALDLSDLPLVAGDNPDVTGDPTIGAGVTVDQIILINNNTANAWAWYYLPGHATDAGNGFLMLRDYDNADGDGDPYTGLDYLIGRHGANYWNGQDVPRAWFVGGINMAPAGAPVPEPCTLALLGLGGAGLALCRRRRGNAR